MIWFPIWCLIKSAVSFFGLSFSLAPYLLVLTVYVGLCRDSSLIISSQFDTSVSFSFCWFDHMCFVIFVRLISVRIDLLLATICYVIFSR